MDIRLPAAFASLLVLVNACQSAPVARPPEPPPATTPASTPATPGRMAALPFRLDLTFSPAARAALAEAGQTVTVRAVHYGHAKTGRSGSRAPSEIPLNEETHGAEGRDSAVRIRGVFDLDRATRDTTGDPRTRVTAEAAGLIICDVFEEALPIAVETGGSIHCKAAHE